MMILDEAKEAEKLIRGGYIEKNLFQKTALVARYYYHRENIKDGSLRDRIECFLSEHYKDYHYNDCSEMINKILNNIDKFPLVQIDNITVTDRELQVIGELPNIRTKRVAFALLCIAKFNNARNSLNHNWVSQKLKVIFEAADVRTTTETQSMIIHELVKRDLVSLGVKVNSTSMCVNYIDNTGSTALTITDLKNLGLQYMYYLQPLKYDRCKLCGRFIKLKGNHHLYCTECSDFRRYQRSLHKKA